MRIRFVTNGRRRRHRGGGFSYRTSEYDTAVPDERLLPPEAACRAK